MRAAAPGALAGAATRPPPPAGNRWANQECRGAATGPTPRRRCRKGRAVASPGQHLRFRQPGGHQPADAAAQHAPDHCPEVGDAAIEAAPVRRRQFNQQNDRTGEFAAGRQALQNPEQRQRQRRYQPGRGVGGPQPHSAGGNGHQNHRQHQRRLAPQTVAQPSEHQAAQRPGREAEGKHSIRVDERRQGIGRGKKPSGR